MHTSLSATVLDAVDQQNDSQNEDSDSEPAQKKRKLTGDPGTDGDETPDPHEDEEFLDPRDFSDQVRILLLFYSPSRILKR
jgi:hypothetical protein